MTTGQQDLKETRKANVDKLINNAIRALLWLGMSFLSAIYIQEDSPSSMRKFAQQHGFSFPYLIDEDQSVGKSFNAICTPDFFGFNEAGELQYRGRFDDARMGGAGQSGQGVG